MSPALATPLDLEPMEALLVEELPDGEGWLFEPKWDGFRCLAFRAGTSVELMSKSGKPLGRYFPEIVEMLEALPVERFVLDGELTIVVLEGAGEFLAADGVTMPAKPGDVLVCPINVPHGIRSITDMRVLVTIAPPP